MVLFNALRSFVRPSIATSGLTAASQLAGQPTSQPVSQPASQPASRQSVSRYRRHEVISRETSHVYTALMANEKFRLRRPSFISQDQLLNRPWLSSLSLSPAQGVRLLWLRSAY